MKRCFALIVVLLHLLPGGGIAQSQAKNKEINISDTFPVPAPNKDMMFYVQRTHNKNTIVYELNYNKDSTLNESEPVKIYWIRYSDHGEIAPLSFIQRKYAYGLEAELTDPVKKTYKLQFVSYKKRTIYLMRSQTDGRYHAFLDINGRMAFFTKAFAKIEGGTFWLPHIAYVELTGREIGNGKKTIERIIP